MTHILATKPMIVDANLWCNRPHERFADMCHTLRDNSNLLSHRCGLIFCWDFCFLKLLMTNFYVTNKQSSEKKEMMTNQAMVHPCQFNTSAASEWKTANDRWEKWKEVHILLKALLAKNMTLPSPTLQILFYYSLKAQKLFTGIIKCVCKSAFVCAIAQTQWCTSEIKRGCGRAVGLNTSPQYL